jgi:hypothetical protein
MIPVILSIFTVKKYFFGKKVDESESQNEKEQTSNEDVDVKAKDE